MENVKLNKNILTQSLKIKFFYFAIGLIVLLLIGFLTMQNTYKNTHKVSYGKVISTYVEPTNRKFKPGLSTILVTVEFKNNNIEYIRIPRKYNPQVGDVLKFEMYESVLFNKKKYIIKK